MFRRNRRNRHTSFSFSGLVGAVCLAATDLFLLGPAYGVAAALGELPAGTGATTSRTDALREEFGRIHTEATTLVQAAGDAKRALTAEEDAAQTQRFARLDAIQKIMDQDKKLAGYAFGRAVQTEKPANAPENVGTVQTETPMPGQIVIAREEAQRTEFGRGKWNDEQREEFGRAMTEWGRTGAMPQKFATITTATQSSILLPKSVAMPINLNAANTFREAHAIWGKPVMSTPTTETVNIPVIDASSGGQVAENASSETTNTPALTESIISTCYTYQSGSVYFSNMQLAATSFDLFGATQPALEYSKELGLESVIAAAMVADSGITQSVATSTVTGFTYTNLVNLNRKLAKKYDRMKAILLGTAAYSAAEALVDSQGRPLLVQDTQNQELKRFNGTPVLRCDYLQAFGANNVVGLLISLMGFHLRDAGQTGVQRYTQVVSKPNQTGFNMFSYHAYGYAPSACAKLTCPAS